MKDWQDCLVQMPTVDKQIAYLDNEVERVREQMMKERIHQFGAALRDEATRRRREELTGLLIVCAIAALIVAGVWTALEGI